MNPTDLSNSIMSLIGVFAKASSEFANVVLNNATHGMATVNTNLIHQHGGVGDDPGLIAALQTAAGAPKQGAWTGKATA